MPAAILAYFGFPSKGKAHCRVLIRRQRFHDCIAANNLFFFLGERKRGKKKGRSGDCAATGSAPRDPPENGQAGRDEQQRCCAQRKKFPYSGKSRSFVEQRGTTRLSLPLKGEGYSVRGRTFNNLNSDAVIKPLSIKQNPKNTPPLRQGENWKETPICDRCAICIVDISQKFRYNIIQTAHDKKPHKSVK